MNRYDNPFTNWWRTSTPRNIYWWIKHHIDPRHRYHMINTGLGYGYHDVDGRMLYGCMALLCSYVEHEQHGEVEFQKWTDQLLDPNQEDDEWGSKQACITQGVRQQETLAIYRWWKYQYPEDKKNEDYLIDLCYSKESGFSLKDMCDIAKGTMKSPEREYNLSWLHALGEKIEQDEEEMLIRLMKIRTGLWT